MKDVTQFVATTGVETEDRVQVKFRAVLIYRFSSIGRIKKLTFITADAGAGTEMILFKKEHKPLILNGIKTQTRRTGKKRWKIGSVHLANTGFRKDDAFGRILITDVRREQLGSITEEDARKEGCDSVDAYKQIFQFIYGRWVPEEEVWVIDFELLEALTHENR